jgi:hypothetical protein
MNRVSPLGTPYGGNAGETPVSLSVILPAWNEAAGIRQSVETILVAIDSKSISAEIIVVSDGSTDETCEIVRSMPDPRVVLIDFEQNRGKGAALRSGFDASRGELVAFFDADGDITIDSLLGLADQLVRNNCDAVVGSKAHPRSVVSYPAFRRIQSRAFRQLVKLLFSMEVGDTQTGAKVLRRRLLVEVMPHIQADGFEFDLEMIAIASKMGFSLEEGPITLNFNFTSSVRPRDALKVLGGTIRVRTALNTHLRTLPVSDQNSSE